MNSDTLIQIQIGSFIALVIFIIRLTWKVSNSMNDVTKRIENLEGFRDRIGKEVEDNRDSIRVLGSEVQKASTQYAVLETKLCSIEEKVMATNKEIVTLRTELLSKLSKNL